MGKSPLSIRMFWTHITSDTAIFLRRSTQVTLILLEFAGDRNNGGTSFKFTAWLSSSIVLLVVVDVRRADVFLTKNLISLRPSCRLTR